MLRDYQQDIAAKGLRILKEFGLLYLAMEVRCGKTLTSMAVADAYGAKRVLFVTKKKAIGSIQRDFTSLNPGFTLYVCNYEQLPKVDPKDADFIILDEAHSLGQYPVPAARLKLVKKICEAKPVVFLSGTPTPESFSQIYHQLAVSCNTPFRDYKNFYAWAKDFVTIKKKYFYNRECNDYSHANKEKVMAAINHIFITWTQEQSGFTQFVDEHILPVRMKESTYALASKLRARRVVIGKEGKEVVADTEVKLMNKLHQIYSGTVILESPAGEVEAFDDTKARYIAANFAGKKIAVFYKFKGEAALLRWAFAGRVTESPEEFAHRHDLVFISQIQSGREGINLSTADALVMFNIDFSHVSYLQARARLQTKDRETPCPMYWVMAIDGIEEKILERVRAKEDYQLAYFKQDFKVQPVKKVA